MCDQRSLPICAATGSQRCPKICRRFAPNVSRARRRGSFPSPARNLRHPLQRGCKCPGVEIGQEALDLLIRRLPSSMRVDDPMGHQCGEARPRRSHRGRACSRARSPARSAAGASAYARDRDWPCVHRRNDGLSGHGAHELLPRNSPMVWSSRCCASTPGYSFAPDMWRTAI